jgi:hypothetical protein
MTFEEVRAVLKQRFPVIMIDSVVSLEPGKSIRAIKNVTGNEVQIWVISRIRRDARNSDCGGHRPAASILFSSTMVREGGQGNF